MTGTARLWQRYIGALLRAYGAVMKPCLSTKGMRQLSSMRKEEIMSVRRIMLMLGLVMATLTVAITLTQASSHREAPLITEFPKVDGTDFYLFRSYEPGRENFVTFIANYIPLQVPYGGPNFFTFDPDALYEIHIDNNGDGQEDLTFQFRFQNTLRDLALTIGTGNDSRRVSVPLINIGGVGPGVNDTSNVNVLETYTLTLVRGNRRSGQAQPISHASTGATTFSKPVDNIGNKSIAAYEAYARGHIFPLAIPGCSATGGRVFVGQRQEPFFVNLGEIFDLVNVPKPVGEQFAAARRNILDDVNISSMILELPISCLTAGSDPVIGAWMSASLRQARVLNAVPSSNPQQRDAAVEGGAWTQVSRLSAPLINEVIIGLKDKDRFNASEPITDAQFADYVTHPTFPALLEALFGAAGVRAPTLIPRTDLVAAFLTGINTAATGNLNQPRNVQPAEMMRLNTSIAPTPRAQQQRLGVIGSDLACFPNGRRPGDDVVDIELRVAMGRLISLGLFGAKEQAPSGSLDFTDGAFGDASMFDESFPYLKTPLPGSPQ
jgi:hypothetical protein